MEPAPLHRRFSENANHLRWRAPPNPCGPSSPQSPPPLVVRGKSLSLNKVRVNLPNGGAREKLAVKELSRNGRKQRLLLSQAGSLSLKRRDTSPDFHAIHESKARPKRDPLPMRLRALPQSFWQEPNTIDNSTMSMGNNVRLPALFHNENNTGDDVLSMRPVTPPDEKNRPRPSKQPKLVITSPPEQLLKLFETVEEDKTKKYVVKRGRPRRVQSDLTHTMLPKVEEDPCMMDNIAEKLFPQLSLDSQKPSSSANASLSCVSVQGDGNKAVSLPSINVEQNYSAMLSQIVAHM